MKQLKNKDNMKKLDITTDGFVWLPISEEQAIKIFNNEIEDIYVLCDDGADWLIESIEEITEAIQSGCQVCLKVGHLSTQIKKTAVERPC